MNPQRFERANGSHWYQRERRGEERTNRRHAKEKTPMNGDFSRDRSGARGCTRGRNAAVSRPPRAFVWPIRLRSPSVLLRPRRQASLPINGSSLPGRSLIWAVESVQVKSRPFRTAFPVVATGPEPVPTASMSPAVARGARLPGSFRLTPPPAFIRHRRRQAPMALRYLPEFVCCLVGGVQF